MPAPDFSVELELSPPDDQLLQQARDLCGEHPHTRLQAIAELRDMVYERGECTPYRVDDDFLLRFLRARQFVPRRAHRLMVNYFRFREENPELFQLYPMDLQHLGASRVLIVPPYTDHNGRRLIFYRIGAWEPSRVSVTSLLAGTVLSLQLSMLEARTQILGSVALFDLEGVTTQHVWQLTPALANKVVKLLVTSFPTTTHAIHVVGAGWVFERLWSLFRPLLTSDMRARVMFHPSLSSLHFHLPPDILPARYGGVCPEFPYTVWLDSLCRNYAVARELLGAGYKFRPHELSPDLVERLNDEGIALE